MTSCSGRRYLRLHIINAVPMTRGDYNLSRGWTIPANEDPADTGYQVTYPDGYVSWCPTEQFEGAGRQIYDEPLVPFSYALECMLKGQRVRLQTWDECYSMGLIGTRFVVYRNGEPDEKQPAGIDSIAIVGDDWVVCDG